MSAPSSYISFCYTPYDLHSAIEKDEACPSPQVIKSEQNDLQKDWGTQEKNNYEQSINLVNKPMKNKVEETALEPKNDLDILKELQVLNHPTADIIDKKDTSLQSDKQYKMDSSITDFHSKTSNKELSLTPNMNTTTDDSKTNQHSQFRNSFYNNKIIQNYSGSILVLTCSLIIIATYLRMTV